MARWIKYQIVCNADKNILLNKKLEYSDANLIIAQNEAHEGAYTIEEDEKNIEKDPLGIEFGGTHAKSAEGARANLDVYSKKEVETLGLPTVTATDNGKFMRVVNGAWAATEITDASGVSF